MFRKSNIKVLAALFVVLLAVVLVFQFTKSGKEQRTFRKDLFTADTSKVTQMLIYPRTTGFNEVKLDKKAGGWEVSSNGQTFDADPKAIKAMMDQLARMKPEQVAATTSDKWEAFEVTDSLANRLKVFVGDQKVIDILIGKFEHRATDSPYQQQGRIITYVRMTDETETYAVDGFLNMAFNRSAEQIRLKLTEETLP